LICPFFYQTKTKTKHQNNKTRMSMSTCSCAGLFIYSVGRILYGHGYATKGADGRKLGALLSHVGDLPLLICTGVSAAKLMGLF
jgi:hypothetical protein